MACATCGRKGGGGRGTRGVQNARTRSAGTRALAADNGVPVGMVLVEYRGPHGNHYIPSPSRKVRKYRYGRYGTQLHVYEEDVALRPDLFFVINQAPKVWPAPVFFELPEPTLETEEGDEGSEELEIELNVEVIEEEDAGEADDAQVDPIPEIEEDPDAEAKTKEDLIHDDLSSIKGIGPARVALLDAAGITSFADMIKLGAEELANVLNVTLTTAEGYIAKAKEYSQ